MCISLIKTIEKRHIIDHVLLNLIHMLILVVCDSGSGVIYYLDIASA